MVSEKELKRHGLSASVRFISEMCGAPPAFPQPCKVRFAEDCFESAVMIGIDEDGHIILRYSDGDEESGIYGWDDIFVLCPESKGANQVCSPWPDPVPSLSKYHNIINHPDNGEMLNLTQSAKYLGITRKKFYRIAPPPDYVQDSIYPFWSRRVLDILPVSEEFSQGQILKKGTACGNYLISGMNEEEMKKLRSDLATAEWAGDSEERISRILRDVGVRIKFRSEREAKVFRDGVLSAIKLYVILKLSTMENAEARTYIMNFWGGGSYEQLLQNRKVL